MANYTRALPHYLRELERGTFDHLVLVENSGYPLDALQGQVDEAGLTGRATLVTVSAVLGPDNSRFALELDLLTSALAHPDIAALGDVRFWKVTGRYVILNIRELVRTAPRDADGYFHTRTRPVLWTEFFVAAFDRRCFERLFRDNMAEFAESENGEEVLFDLVNCRRPAELDIVVRMRRVPRISGVRGFDGRHYGDMRGRLGYAVRWIANRVAPGLWI